jgi:hypothetical protein
VERVEADPLDRQKFFSNGRDTAENGRVSGGVNISAANWLSSGRRLQPAIGRAPCDRKLGFC